MAAGHVWTDRRFGGSPPVAVAVLWGRDHVRYDEVGLAVPTDGVALALSRGKIPKPYAYVDPNEDVVAAAVGPTATLLVVADGHSGVEAAEIAVESILRQAGEPSPQLSSRLAHLFAPAHEAVLTATAEMRRRNRESRTTLTIGLLTRGWLSWASLGDSALMVVTPRQGVTVTTARHRFVGASMPTREVLADIDMGQVEVPDDAWVVAATDGFLNFTLTGDPARAAAVVLGRQRTAADAARALVAHAFSGGAGDNVAVAVVEPEIHNQGNAT